MSEQAKGPIRYELAPYDRALHEGFVCASWCRGARESWWELSNYLRRPTTKTIVAHVPGSPDDLLGWAAATPDALIWAYVRNLHGAVRRRGLGSALVFEVGFDLTAAIPCLYWSPTAAAIASAGAWNLVYHPRKEAA